MENESEMAGENNKRVIRMYSDKFGCIRMYSDVFGCIRDKLGCIRLAPFSTLLSIDCSLLSTVSLIWAVYL